MNKRSLAFLLFSVSACSLSPDFEIPKMDVPSSYREQPAEAASPEGQGSWKVAEPLEKADRGLWWKIFADEALNELEGQASEANQSLKAAAARVEQARSLAGTVHPSIFPDINVGANAVRAQPSSASLAAFGGSPNAQLKPYTLYSAQGVASYEADILGRVRDNYAAYSYDADREAAAYHSMLLALQADVAQTYFNLRTLDTERQLLRDTVAIREEANRIMTHRFEAGETGEQDISRTQSELASVRAELVALDRRRAILEHALAVFVGKMPSTFMLVEAPLTGIPPEIPAGLPSTLLERRPDIAAAQSAMAAANARIGVARTAFFPRLFLTASGGFESVSLSDLFMWSSHTWALGQLAGSALTMPIFDSGRNLANLSLSEAAYEEAVANYKQQVLVAFKDVEDNLSDQRLLVDQSREIDKAADAATRTTDLSQKRYDEGEVDYFEVVNTQRDALAAQRAAVQTKGQRFVTTIALIRSLGGGWQDYVPPSPPPAADTPPLQ